MNAGWEEVSQPVTYRSSEDGHSTSTSSAGSVTLVSDGGMDNPASAVHWFAEATSARSPAAEASGAPKTMKRTKATARKRGSHAAVVDHRAGHRSYLGVTGVHGLGQLPLLRDLRLVRPLRQLRHARRHLPRLRPAGSATVTAIAGRHHRAAGACRPARV
jgi:hypothetical protein